MISTEKYYNEKSSSYDLGFDNLYFKVSDTITWKYLEPYLPSDSDALVLDAAGGTGRWAIPIARKGCKVVLLDLSERMLNIAKKNIAKYNLQDRVSLKQGDITKLVYRNETFDLVFCEHALFLFSNPDIVIKELVRVLKRKHPLVISAQNKYPMALQFIPEELDKATDLLYGKYSFSLMLKDERGNMHLGPKVNVITPEEFKRLLERNELKIEKIIGKGITMPLRINPDVYLNTNYSKDLFERILQIELALCEKPDALGLAGHLQAIAYKL